jgi:hypothetical protein
MKTKNDLMDFLELSVVPLEFEKLVDHPEWDSIVALDLISNIEKNRLVSNDVALEEWLESAKWEDLYKIFGL